MSTELRVQARGALLAQVTGPSQLCRRDRRAGLRELTDAPHGFFSFPTLCRVSQPALELLVAELRRTLWSPDDQISPSS
jgi:hypothetical protein